MNYFYFLTFCIITNSCLSQPVHYQESSPMCINAAIDLDEDGLQFINLLEKLNKISRRLDSTDDAQSILDEARESIYAYLRIQYGDGNCISKKGLISCGKILRLHESLYHPGNNFIATKYDVKNKIFEYQQELVSAFLKRSNEIKQAERDVDQEIFKSLSELDCDMFNYDNFRSHLIKQGHENEWLIRGLFFLIQEAYEGIQFAMFILLKNSNEGICFLALALILERQNRLRFILSQYHDLSWENTWGCIDKQKEMISDLLEKSITQGEPWAKKIKEADIIAKSSLDLLKRMWK